MSSLEVRAEIVGTVVEIDCSVGERVAEGSSLLAIESMKMEYPILAPASGSIVQLKVDVGDVVAENQLLILIHP